MKKLGDSFYGFTTSGDLRYVFSDPNIDLVGVVDCFGQVFLYDLTCPDPFTPVFTEKLYGEAFAVSVSSDILAIVCPLKIILYRVDVTEKSFVPMKSVLTETSGESWTGVCILSGSRVLGFSTHGILDLISEQPMDNRTNAFAKRTRVHKIGPNRLLSVSDGIVTESIVVSDTVISYPVIRKKKFPESCHHHTFCSDGSHVFFAEYNGSSLHVSPLSIPDCSFELELPQSSISTVNGLVMNRRILAGLANGSVCGWMVGSSKIDFHITNVADGICPIIRLMRLKDSPTDWIGCLDAGGTITVIDRKSKILKLRPNLLMPLLVRGFKLSLRVDLKASAVTCTINHRDEESEDVEVWSLLSKQLVSSDVVLKSKKDKTKLEPVEDKRSGSFQFTDIFFPSSRRGSQQIEPAEIPDAKSYGNEFELVPGISVKPSWDFQHQLVSFDPGLNLGANGPMRELIDQLFQKRNENKWRCGTSYGSALTGTCQASFHRNGVDKTLHALFFPNTGVEVDIGRLIDLLEKSEWNSAGKTVLRLLQNQIAKVANLSLENPIEVLVGLCVRPHALPGFRAAVTEVERGELPWSRMTDSFVITVEKILQKIHDRTAKWFEIDLFAEAFPFIRKLITNKALSHEVFGILFAEVVVDRRNLESSELATKCLLAIGARNPTKFAKRLALMVKTNHAADVPLFLIRRLVEDYRIHSMRFLSVLFESVVLPSLNPMDYRVRKTSVEPVTELFKTLNKLYPMTTFHQNRQKFALGTTQGQVIIYDLRSSTKWRILDGHTGAISAVGFDASGKYLCSYSATDCTARVWYISSGGVPGVNAVIVHGNTTSGSVLGSLLGSSGGKCVIVKQLGGADENSHQSSIKHPFDLNCRINGVKIRWTTETDVLVVRETGEGIQIRL
jgi:hypothetical protein